MKQEVIAKHFLLSDHLFFSFYGKVLYVNSLGRDLESFCVKGQMGNILGFGGHTGFVAPTQV